MRRLAGEVMISQWIDKLHHLASEIPSSVELSKEEMKERKSKLLIPLLEILQEIENRPIMSDDMRLLRSVISDYLKQCDLLNDKELTKIVMRRFSYSYLPCVTNLELKPYIQNFEKVYGTCLSSSLQIQLDKAISEVEESNVIIGNNNNGKRVISRPPTPVSFLPNPALQQWQQEQAHNNNEASNTTVYFLCSLRRHQSTLWTSYRLYLDGTQEVDASGECIKTTICETPVILLGAKRLKSGIAAQCFVWKNEDSKYWKEKLAVGKIIRTNNMYFGVPLIGAGAAAATAAGQQQHQQQDSLDGSSIHSTAQQIDTALTAASLDTSSDSVLPLPPAVQQTISGSPPAVDSCMTALPPSLSLPSSSASGGVGGNQSNASTTTSDLINLVPVGISVTQHGLEKLISLTISLPSKQSYVSIGGDGNSITQSTIAELEQSLRNPGANITPGMCILRSKLPRRLAASSTSTTQGNANNAATRSSMTSLIGIGDADGNVDYGVTFGRLSRIRAPSRKNVAMDVYYDGGSGLGGGKSARGIQADWASAQGPSLPTLQIGKMEEDLFAVDFSTSILSSFQAFAVALAVFDQ